MRSHYLVSYDISDPKRLDRVRKLVSDSTERVQYSVYYGQFSERDLAVLREKLRDAVNQRDDQVLFIRLGPVAETGGEADALERRVEVLGRAWERRDLTVMVF
jgi:CRISPR-associated protein Cas2